MKSITTGHLLGNHFLHTLCFFIVFDGKRPWNALTKLGSKKKNENHFIVCEIPLYTRISRDLFFGVTEALRYKIGWYSLIGYVISEALEVSSGSSLGFDVRQYCEEIRILNCIVYELTSSSPNDDNRLAPYVLISPSCLHKPNSIVNQ